MLLYISVRMEYLRIKNMHHTSCDSSTPTENRKKSQYMPSYIQKTGIVFVKPNLGKYEAKFTVDFHVQSIVPMAKTVLYGNSFAAALSSRTKKMKITERQEVVGEVINVSEIIDVCKEKLYNHGDKVRESYLLHDYKEPVTKKNMVVDAGIQLERIGSDTNNCNILYEMAVRHPRCKEENYTHTEECTQKLFVSVKPCINLSEKVFIMNVKGKVTAVIKDDYNKNVLLTNSGNISLKNSKDLLVFTENKTVFEPFISMVAPLDLNKESHDSIGEGGEIIIGMEEGRFNAEIVNSIKEFEEMIDDDKIILPQFIAKEDAKNIQMTMLAGGYGSRAEYTFAPADGIFHGIEEGAQSTKGVFRTPTGLTPMETTMISLHMAGLLDCSKGSFGIGKNVRFYLNKSGINKGNGGFTIDLYNKSIGEQKCEFIFPNDSISRMPIAISKAADLMNSGKAAIAMIAKKVPDYEAKGNYGIMKLSEENEILEFAEKPHVIEEGFADKDNNCFSNTFQFAVSREAFEALRLIDPYFSSSLKGSETRDWSKQLIPTIMVLSKFDTPEEMKSKLRVVAGMDSDPHYIDFLDSVPNEILITAKNILKGQKVYAVPTDESWSDVGQLSALYENAMQIAKGEFKLLDFERHNVIRCVNPYTGLVAMTPEERIKIEEKYDIYGQVMAIPQIKAVDQNILNYPEIKKALIINEKSYK